jgi:tetratricopeptide (TPR) repeat protein
MKRFSLLVVLLLAGLAANAAPVEDLQRSWAIANYELTGDVQVAAFEKLVAEADTAALDYPNDTAIYIWQGIIQSTYAGKIGGLGALKWVKAARQSLEQALEMDPNALDGSAYTSLGALYYQVPGWPIAFGSDKKAKDLLERAIALNPNGIDPNYFYGDFLVNQKEYAAARKVLNKALGAKARPGRELADRGRRKEIRALLQRIEEKTSQGTSEQVRSSIGQAGSQGTGM